MNKRQSVGFALAAMLIASSAGSAGAQESVAPGAVAADDHAAIFRYDPFERKLLAVPAGEVKAGYLYSRYSAPLKRRVWSMGRADGGFEYAMATGSVQPAWRLDLRATREQQLQTLIDRAPELANIMDIRGSRAYVQLDEKGEWQLMVRPPIANLYDEETLRRWEWHGERRVAVMHTYGYEWLLVDGKFVPATYGGTMYGLSSYVAPSTCCW
jgi:hypothetical protein